MTIMYIIFIVVEASAVKKHLVGNEGYVRLALYAVSIVASNIVVSLFLKKKFAMLFLAVDFAIMYGVFVFGNGAIALGNGNPVGFVATEMDRDKQTGAGVDYLINRKAFILHPRGIAYTGAVRENVETPLRTELANAKNWNPVYEPKQLRLIAIKHKLG